MTSLPGCTGRLGVMGVCLAGHLAFRAALHPEVSAAACFYPTDLHSATLGEGKHDDSLARYADSGKTLQRPELSTSHGMRMSADVGKTPSTLACAMPSSSQPSSPMRTIPAT